MPEIRPIQTNGERDWNGIAQEQVLALRARFESGETRSYAWRMKQLTGLERFLKERDQDILEALAADVGKPRMEAWGAEVGYCRGDLKYAKKNLRKWMKPERVRTSMVAMPGKSYVYREPLGVALIISPWNFPFQLGFAPLIGALAAGNCVLLKPSEVSPATAELFARWLPKYVDDSAVKVMQGGVPETTALLAQRWDHIFYTGSTAVGRIVMQAAAKHLTPVTLELGGQCPAIVDKTANIDVAARRIALGKWTNAGQICLAPNHVLVEEEVHDALVNRLRATIREFYGDDPQQSADYARMVNAHHHARVSRLLQGMHVAAGGETDVDDLYIAPTMLTNVKEDDLVMQEEIFGPVLPVISVPHVDAAISFVNRGEKPLALYVFSNDKEAQERVLGRTSAGGSAINHIWLHFSVHDLPFGGVGESGMGAYHGRYSFETFSHRRGVLKKSNLPDAPIMFPPYTALKERLLRRLL